MKNQEQTISDLVYAAKQEDQHAFRQLLDLHWNELYGFMIKRTENENDAENESSESEYEEIIVRKKVKKKSSKKRSSKKASVQKETNLDGEENIANMSHLANFVNQFEGVDPFNFQVVAPGQ